MNIGPTRRTEVSAKKWENAGQVVLWSAALVTVLAFFSGLKGNPWSSWASDAYGFVVDSIFAGVLASAYISFCRVGYGAVFFARWRP